MDALASLAERLPDGAVSTHPGELSTRSRDAWALAMLREVRGDRLPRPLAVVFPTSTQDVSAVLAWASETGTPVVPRGAGSGVCGGAQAIWRGVVLDLSRMQRIVELDEGFVHVEAGIRGDRLEAALAERGLTLGHYPQSIAISSVGGWIASASAGQASARYGAIEDLLLGATIVLATGEVLRLPAVPRSAAGPDLRRLFVGSEGTLGVVTEAALVTRRRPAGMRWIAASAGAFEEGFPLARSLVSTGGDPLVLRLYDDTDATIAFGDLKHPGGAVLIAAFGDDEVGAAAMRAAASAIEAAGGSPLGVEYGEHWWEHRNDAVALYRRVMGEERILGRGAIVDTMEVAGLWRDLPALYGRVRAALAGPATQAVACHLSHPYPSGASLYFTFLIRAEDDDSAEREYLEAWRRAASACHAARGTVTHHHGVGILKAPFLEAEVGATGISVLRALKGALDPAGVLNPDKLLPA